MGDSLLKALFKKIYIDIQSWAYTNSVLVYASGYTIGYSTFFYVTGLLGLLSPIKKIIINNIEKIGRYVGISNKNILYYLISLILNIILLTITWLFTILITFLLIEYILSINLLGLKTNIKEKEKKDFILAKTIAKEEKDQSIIENTKKLEIKNEKEDLLGTKILKNEENELESLNENELFKNLNYNNLINKIY